MKCLFIVYWLEDRSINATGFASSSGVEDIDYTKYSEVQHGIETAKLSPPATTTW